MGKGAKCAVDGCENRAHARGHCKKHYGQIWRGGKVRSGEEERQMEAEKLLPRRDSDRIDESFRLASEALAVGVTYSSERIIDRARRFRREYSGPATSYVRDFDDQLRSALLLDSAHVPHRDLRPPRPARSDRTPS